MAYGSPKEDWPHRNSGFDGTGIELKPFSCGISFIQESVGMKCSCRLAKTSEFQVPSMWEIFSESVY